MLPNATCPPLCGPWCHKPPHHKQPTKAPTRASAPVAHAGGVLRFLHPNLLPVILARAAARDLAAVLRPARAPPVPRRRGTAPAHEPRHATLGRRGGAAEGAAATSGATPWAMCGPF